ncbi:MAG: hypothetical protein ABI091_29705 [Ferruginibacter sp.]
MNTLLITKPQITKINVMLFKMGLMDNKAEFVYKASDGRVTSTKELLMDEASELIKHLSKYDPLERMRNKVFALAYEAGIIYGNTPADKKMNFHKLNNLLKERGTIKKEINKLNKEELIKVINQFEQIVKHNNENFSNKNIKQMLSELNIQTQESNKHSKHM